MLLWDLPELGVPFLSLFYSLYHRQIEISGHKMTKPRERISHIPYSLSNVTSRQYSQTQFCLKWKAVIVQKAWTPDWHYLLTTEDWDSSYRGVLEPCSRQPGNVWTIISANKVDILTLVISFPGAKAMSLLWKLLTPFLCYHIDLSHRETPFSILLLSLGNRLAWHKSPRMKRENCVLSLKTIKHEIWMWYFIFSQGRR